MSPTAKLFIDGHWTDGDGHEALDVQNPASNENFGNVAVAEIADLDRATEAASRAFSSWRNVSAYERGNILKSDARKL